MTRMSAYLVRLFSKEALQLFAVTLTLIWVIQWLRIFDVVSAKGQSLLTLFGQAALTMPPLAVVFLYVCMGIGLGRVLRALQTNHELHIIHSNQRERAVIGAVGVYAALGAALVLLLANFVQPMAGHKLDQWSASIAADIVGRTLTPHSFSEIVPGVVMVIGGRDRSGEIVDFFADDRRDPATRRTYVAKSATIAQDNEGYVLQLHNGHLQYTTAAQELSEISFGRYNVPLQKFTGPSNSGGQIDSRDSLDLIREGLSTGKWESSVVRALVERNGEGLRVIAMCLFVAALAAFPHARRGKYTAPLEIVVLAAAFIERGMSTYLPVPAVVSPLAGAVVMLIIALVILTYRLRLLHRRVRRVQLA
jgi:lipopolysaccharide export system permease protein